MIDLIPAAIATRLLPDDATPAMRQIAEAMAEVALRLTVAQTEVGKMFGIERLMAQTGKAVYDQHLVRCERALKMIEEWQEPEESGETEH